MCKWSILVLLIQNLVVGELLNQNETLFDVGETMSNQVEEPDTLNVEHNLLKDAVKIVQIEALADLKQTIKDLGHENDEKEKQIEKMRKEKNYEIRSIKEDFERKLDENILVKKLNDQTTLVNYLMIIISKSQQVYSPMKDLIKNHAQDMNELQTKLGECKQRNIDNLKIVFDTKQTIFKQKESIARLEKLLELENNLTQSKEDISKSECNTVPWIENLTKAYNEQEQKIDELILYIEDQDAIEEHMNSIEASLSKINHTNTVDESQVLPRNQQLVQLENISMLEKLASYAINNTTAFLFKKDEDSGLISSNTCNCLPEPLTTAGLKQASIIYKCENWANPIFTLNCEEGTCLNNYWPKCVQTEEDVFEWSSWSLEEMTGARTRTSMKVSNIWQRERKGEHLLTLDGYHFYKVPVAHGTRMVKGAVAETCKENGMMAVCFGDSGCRHNSDQCKETSLKASCGDGTINAISKLICNGSRAPTCPQTYGMFVYMKDYYSGSECGNVKGIHCVDGKDYESQKINPYYAFCVV